MKKILLVIIMAAACLTACKTSEANYKAAYETVIEKQRGATPTDGTIYNRFRDRVVAHEVITAAGDTLSVRVEAIAFVGDGGITRDDMLKYNVIVGGFKQIFNARALRDRLANNGYKSFIISTAEPLYYVGAATAGTLDEVAPVVERLSADPDLRLRSPYPFILQPLHLK